MAAACITDPEGRILYANPAAPPVLPLHEAIDARDAADLATARRGLLHGTGAATSVEVRRCHHDGHQQRLRLTLALPSAATAGAASRIMVTATNITRDHARTGACLVSGVSGVGVSSSRLPVSGHRR